MSEGRAMHVQRDRIRWVAGVLIGLLLVLSSAAGVAQTPVERVNTLRGSNSRPEYSRGNTFPAVTVPFGFNFWTPISEGNSSSWLYRYDRATLQGFGVCHQPSPWVGDHGGIQIMPQVGALQLDPSSRALPFRHEREVARPDYYSVEFDLPAIRVEFTPTDHASRFRFTFPAGEPARLLFDSIADLTGSIRVDAESREITGAVDHAGPRLYFVASVDRAIAGSEYPDGTGVSAAIRFEAGGVIELKMATSFISVEQARANLESEIGTRSFEEVRALAAALWNDELSAIEVEGATDRQLVTFYSSLYRTMMYPNSMWESVDGEAVHFSPYDQALHPGKIWVNNGFWDTYRAAWPLYVLLMPERAGQMLEGFVQAYREGGWTPRWSGPGYLDIMVGSHADSVLADAYLKGVRGFDVAAAYASMLQNALVASENGALGRKGNQVSIFKGYVPTDVPESAAWSLENYVNDFGIAQLAAALQDELHATYFRSRAALYAELFSNEVGFFRGRQRDGHWRTLDENFEPREWGYEFTEGNAWHYALAANHDPEGMARLYGGRAGLAEKIDGLFDADRGFLVGSYGGTIHEMVEAYDTDLGQYAHANEPTHHILYMYNYAGTPWKTQERVRQVLDEAQGIYGPGLGDGGGYLGDEDNGQMSAWYIFGALGFYPASPGHPEYAIGSPMFPRATLRLPGGKHFSVRAPDNSDLNRYIQRAELNGEPLERSYLTHEQITAGGELTLFMGPEASKWGSGSDAVPTSLSTGGRVQPLRDAAQGGRATASEAQGDHAATAAFDDDSRTEWRTQGGGAWIEYEVGSEPREVTLYTLTSGREDPATDPSSWTLQASNDGATWMDVDARSEERFAQRSQTRVFAAKQPRRATHYRLLLEANGGAADAALAELELLYAEKAEEAAVGPEPTPDAEAPTSGPAQAARDASTDPAPPDAAADADRSSRTESEAGPRDSAVASEDASDNPAHHSALSRRASSGCSALITDPGVETLALGSCSLWLVARERRRRARRCARRAA